ncbi:MAG: hypothetical protein DLM69_03330 [Candidatus Chloroheliales bacterium]|nr:MAG: hypothetical protein DLM69_03330 [Chloroflexota bacterium]
MDNRTLAPLPDRQPIGSGVAANPPQVKGGYGYHNPLPYTLDRQVGRDEAAGPRQLDPHRQLLRQLPGEEVARLERIWQGEQNAVNREQLTSEREGILAQLAQLESVRERLAGELIDIERQLAALQFEQVSE